MRAAARFYWPYCFWIQLCFSRPIPSGSTAATEWAQRTSSAWALAMAIDRAEGLIPSTVFRDSLSCLLLEAIPSCACGWAQFPVLGPQLSLPRNSFAEGF